MWTKILFLCLCLQLYGFSCARKTKRPIDYGSCQRDEYLCINKNCINRTQFCDSVNNCGDNSDEMFCRIANNGKHPSHFTRFDCTSGYPKMAIPIAWKCDGVFDCSNKADEPANCVTQAITLYDDVEHISGAIDARKKAVNWLLGHRQNVSGIDRWGVHAPRIAVALYLSDPKYFDGNVTIGNEIAYETDKQVLVSMLRAKTEPVSLNELALYIHALLVTCSDPRNFHGINLVEKLRHQVNSETDYVSPFVILALCNAKDTMTTADADKLIHAFELKGRTCWSSTQALALMALSCIAKQRNGLDVNSSFIADMSAHLKKYQFDNGSFENMYTTGLVMQALFASDTEDDDAWNMTQAVLFLVKNQNADGSYGNLLNTYFVLAALYYNDLTNISSAHCPNNAVNESVDVLEKLGHKIGKRLFVKYTLWFGDKVDLAYSLEIRVVENMTIFDVMNVAKALDKKYDFSYNLLDRKPYIYQLAGYQDDPEHERYWFLYRTNGTGFASTPISSSPVDIVPKDKEEYIMWYRSGQWIQNKPALLDGATRKHTIGIE